MIGVAVVVAVWFIINTFFVDSFDVLNVWSVLDAVMFSGLALALNFNFLRKRREDGRREASVPVTCRYLEVNAAFYLTVAVMILFLHNWFSLLANGADSLDGNHQAWVIWAAVDTALPVIVGVTGCALWREAGSSTTLSSSGESPLTTW